MSAPQLQRAELPRPEFQRKDWKDFYAAALKEGDEQAIPDLIARAELAILERSGQLFSVSHDTVVHDTLEEQEALDDALYVLHGLRSCIAVHGRLALAA